MERARRLRSVEVRGRFLRLVMNIFSLGPEMRIELTIIKRDMLMLQTSVLSIRKFTAAEGCSVLTPVRRRDRGKKMERQRDRETDTHTAIDREKKEKRKKVY